MARLTPPETGASTSRKPSARNSSPSRRVPSGADELMSMMRAPLPRLSAALPEPSSTSRTIRPSGNMVMSAAAPSAASCGVAAAIPPAASRPARAAGKRSLPQSWNPASSRRLAIGMPIWPSPKKPIRAGGLSTADFDGSGSPTSLSRTCRPLTRWAGASKLRPRDDARHYGFPELIRSRRNHRPRKRRGKGHMRR